MKTLLTILLLVPALSLAKTPVAKKTLKTTKVTSQKITRAPASEGAPIPVLQTTKMGRAPSSDLKMKTSKVPAFEIYKKKLVKGKVEVFRVKSIPRLDIGQEPQFKANENFVVSLPPERTPAAIDVAKKVSPKEIDISKYKLDQITPAGEAQMLVKIDPMFKAPPVAPLEPFTPVAVVQPKPEIQKIDEMNAPELKMLQALIFLEIQKSYNMALALFSELVSEPNYKTEATYQLALTSKALGLYSEYKYQMLKVLADDKKDWQKKAATSLAQSAEPGDKELVAVLDPKIEDLKLELTEIDQYNLNRAKYYLDKNNLTQANAAVEEIPLTSKLNLDAQFLKSVILYKGGHLQEAIAAQSLVLKELIEKSPDAELKSISALTLARMHFQASQYKEAYATYLNVDKTNIEWTQAMIEQAWSQILAEDYEGAAGNMFSLHTDFFKNGFAPESYVVRTVGYLNLCQYGDGARVINDMKKKYTSVQKMLDEYSSQKKSDLSYYDTVKAFAKNPSQKVVDGLPTNFIYELTRHPSFANEQKMINAGEEQVVRYNKITLDLIKKERDILKAQNDVRNQVVLLKKQLSNTSNEEQKKSLKESLAYQDKRLMSYKIQHFIAKKARNSIKELRSLGLARLETEKNEFKLRASQAVKSRFQAMRTTLKNTLDQSEVLNYELYAGAGEHIRYQMAGGDTTDKDRAELKPEDGKSLKWEFRGEVWEDEIGHYRSSLKNVCPRESISQAEVGK